MENLMSTVKSVSELMDEFQSGSIAVPEIQRDVVWKSDQVKSLIDSITLGYPCGALIFWEPRPKDAQLLRSMIRPERLDWLDANDGQLPRYFLIDGQQRVTALASALISREKLKEILVELEDDMPYILVNLKRVNKGSLELEATTDLAGYAFPWVLFNKLFDGSYLREPEFAKLSGESQERIRIHIQRLRDYKFPVQIITGPEYETVAEIFTRVNSLGTQLTGAEIYLARIVPHWRGITREFREYRRDLQQRNYELDLTFLMRAITVVECNVAQIKKLAEKVEKDHPPKRHLDRTWRAARLAIDRTVRALQRGLYLDKSKFITSKNAMVPIVYYFARQSSKSGGDRNALRFFILSHLSEHYGGSGETVLKRDIGTLADPSASPRQNLVELVEVVNKEARQTYRGLRIKPSDVGGLPSKNVLVLLMYILMRERKATDWGSGRRESLADIEPRDLQLHHVFPFNLMVNNISARRWYDDNDYTPADYRAEINDIGNLTFISQAKNVAIRDDAPWQYLPNETTKAIRRAHFVPENPELWKPENYSDFLNARRNLISKAMTQFLRKL